MVKKIVFVGVVDLVEVGLSFVRVWGKTSKRVYCRVHKVQKIDLGWEGRGGGGVESSFC